MLLLTSCIDSKLMVIDKHSKGRFITVHYATDRTIEPGSSSHYGGDFNGTGKPYYGTAKVLITDGPAKALGTRRQAIRGVYTEGNSEILGINRQDSLEFFRDLRAASSNNEGTALLFVHGFNNSFNDAVKRAAQLTYNIDYMGTTLLYSWPSNTWDKEYLTYAYLEQKVKIPPYVADATAARRSAKYLENYLAQVLDTARVKKLFIVAHSMGTLVLTSALKNLIKDSIIEGKTGRFSKIKEIILAAPDIDLAEFRDDLSQELIKAELNVTIYVSGKDRAIKTSELEVTNNAVRLGGTANGVFIKPPIETVDATSACNDYLIKTQAVRLLGIKIFPPIRISGINHDYFVTKTLVLKDIFILSHFPEHISPDNRGLKTKRVRYSLKPKPDKIQQKWVEQFNKNRGPLPPRAIVTGQLIGYYWMF
ncbi:alpha/beta hydrolase (plasmid) [Hymenobacter tibetensis]|uniref:Alpha/beta hydrolase n=1 Tax=Hymenobacter tibetensis TaxID=497967 RepID=A0ABY4D895_9BACT|nr:alpha/beta hydrolase [Hymenobacter tibetensis]UOG77414.1 alpha/beta hydrolase [Hymenobacter tibetensis]